MNLFGYEFLPQVPNSVLFIGLAVVAFIIIWKNRDKFGKKEGEYEPIDLPKEVGENIKGTINIRNKNVFKDFFYLYIGHDKLGRITKWTPFNWSPGKEELAPAVKSNENTALVKAVKGEPIEENFYYFEVIKDTMMGKLKRIFGKGFEYFLVDKSLMTNLKGSNRFIINSNSQYHLYYKIIWVFSEQGKNVVRNLSDRIALEEVTKALADFVPRMVYLETRTAKMLLKAQELQKLEQQKYSSRIEALEKE